MAKDDKDKGAEGASSVMAAGSPTAPPATGPAAPAPAATAPAPPAFAGGIPVRVPSTFGMPVPVAIPRIEEFPHHLRYAEYELLRDASIHDTTTVSKDGKKYFAVAVTKKGSRFRAPANRFFGNLVSQGVLKVTSPGTPVEEPAEGEPTRRRSRREDADDDDEPVTGKARGSRSRGDEE